MKTIRTLRAKNRRLKRQVRVLELERRSSFSFAKKENRKLDRFASMLRSQSETERLFSKKRYSAYMLDLVRRTSAFRIYSWIVQIVRKYSFIRITLKILLALWAALQSGAVFLVSASFFLVLLPFTLLIAQATLILTVLFGKQVNRKNQRRLQNHHITIFFPADKSAFRQPSFFYGMVQAEAQRKNHFCIVVSPYYWSGIGIDGVKKKPYIASRHEYENILVIRRHYYFTLKKKVLLSPSSHITVTEIY